MRHLSRLRLAVLGLLLLAAPAPAFQDAALDERRAAILETAGRFATLPWRAEARHAFHGEDASGVRVDTPDASLDPAGWKPGQENVGMPYCWGGFTSLETFENDLEQECYAGHVPKRGNAPGSRETVGVDCSGLVSRCWNLPLKQSTRSLGALCYELDDYAELLPGDIVNRFDAHVALFVGWADEARTTMDVIEAARLRVEESTYTVQKLRAENFRPMRYKLLDERWQAMPTPTAGRDTLVPAAAPRAFVTRDAAPDSHESPVLPDAMRDGRSAPGDWVRYRALEGPQPEGDGQSRDRGVPACTWMAVAGAPGVLELQRELALAGGSIATGTSMDLEAPWTDLLAAFACFSNPLRDLEPSASAIEVGTYRLGELELDARRVTATIEGQMLSRSTLYPVSLQVECVLSDSVPLLGICEASLTLEIEYEMRGEERVVGRQEYRYTITGYGRG